METVTKWIHTSSPSSVQKNELTSIIILADLPTALRNRLKTIYDQPFYKNTSLVQQARHMCSQDVWLDSSGHLACD